MTNSKSFNGIAINIYTWMNNYRVGWFSCYDVRLVVSSLYAVVLPGLNSDKGKIINVPVFYDEVNMVHYLVMLRG